MLTGWVDQRGLNLADSAFETPGRRSGEFCRGREYPVPNRSRPILINLAWVPFC